MANTLSKDRYIFIRINQIIIQFFFNVFFSLCVEVTGPEFQHIGVGVGHRLDLASSGVLGETCLWCDVITDTRNQVLITADV